MSRRPSVHIDRPVTYEPVTYEIGQRITQADMSTAFDEWSGVGLPWAKDVRLVKLPDSWGRRAVVEYTVTHRVDVDLRTTRKVTP
jgi:hypothetical protein